MTGRSKQGPPVPPLYRRWPWLAHRKARKAPERAYTGALRQARIVTIANVGLLVLNIVTHQVFFIAVTIAGLSQSSWQCWSLPRRRELFLERRSALKRLVEDFEEHWHNRTWTGAHPSESALLGAPVALGVGLWHQLLLAPSSPPAQSVALGAVAGLALALRHVTRRPVRPAAPRLRDRLGRDRVVHVPLESRDLRRTPIDQEGSHA